MKCESYRPNIVLSRHVQEVAEMEAEIKQLRADLEYWKTLAKGLAAGIPWADAALRGVEAKHRLMKGGDE